MLHARPDLCCQSFVFAAAVADGALPTKLPDLVHGDSISDNTVDSGCHWQVSCQPWFCGRVAIAWPCISLLMARCRFMCIIFTVIVLLMFSFAVVGTELFANEVTSKLACTDAASGTSRLLAANQAPFVVVQPENLATATTSVQSPHLPTSTVPQSQFTDALDAAATLEQQVETARQRLQMLEAQLAQQHASRDGPGPARRQQHNTAAPHRRADVRRVEKAQRPRPAMAGLQQRRSLSSLPSCDSLPSFVDVNMSFDTFLDAMLVLFQMVTTSNWHEVMYTAMWATGA